MMKIFSVVLALSLSMTALAVDSDRWQTISHALFPDVVIQDDTSVVTLTTMSRAEDAAIVPVTVHTMFSQTHERYITDIWLIIDQNPSPVAAHFQFTPQAGQADIETRVRINEYTLVRAIARTNTGEYHQSVRFIKASGGCSAPATKDLDPTSLGRIKLYTISAQPGRPSLLQAQIRHPNESGLAMDQLTRNYAPAHYVRHLVVATGGKDIITADLDISISENPLFQFYVSPTVKSDISVSFTDNLDAVWSAGIKSRE